jgi:hypothetical protein
MWLVRASFAPVPIPRAAVGAGGVCPSGDATGRAVGRRLSDQRASIAGRGIACWAALIGGGIGGRRGVFALGWLWCELFFQVVDDVVGV